MSGRRLDKGYDNGHGSLPRNMKRSTRKLISLRRRDLWDVKNIDKMGRLI